MYQLTNFPSHIIVYADKIHPKDNILTFCTNVQNENPDTGFTYLCYDAPSPREDACSVINEVKARQLQLPSVFVISDSGEAIRLMNEQGIACAALGTNGAGSGDFYDALYCIEDIEQITYKTVVRMWKRGCGLPWTIAETSRILIREQTIADIPALYEVYADDDATKYMEALYDDPKREEEYLTDYIANQYSFYEYGIWAVVKKDDGKLIGRAGISMREGFDIPELGYIIAKPYRGCGYAKEALLEIMKYAADELDMNEFIAFTKDENAASVHLLESLGFSKSGYEDIKDGRHAMYSLTKQQ